MAYTKKTWINLPNQTTPINATGMNDLETRISSAISLNDVLSVPTNDIANGDDLNIFVDEGAYKCNTAGIAQSLINCPHSSSAFKLFVMKMHDISRYSQIIIASDNTTSIYVRNYGTNGWTNWYKLNMTVVS